MWLKSPNRPKKKPAKQNPKAAAPKTASPKTASPKTASPKTASPKTVAPKTVAPKTAAPKTVAPKTVAPKTTAPKAKAAKGKTTQPKEAEPIKKEDEGVIEDVPLDEADEDSPPPLETPSTNAQEQKAQKLNKNEKKARKAIGKLGLKPVPGINRVTMKKGQDILFIINNPEIFKTSNSDSYVIFGDAKIENLSNNQLASKVKEVVENAEAQPEAKEEKAAAPVVVQETPKVQIVDDEASVDETGLKSEDIELLMTQTGVSRARAIRELKATNGDLVTAIMNATEN